MRVRSTSSRTGGANSRTVLASVIAGIFAATAVGVWYDPSDFSSMYQDSVGTAPVTAVEQPVGLMLDKSTGGLLRGVEQSINGDFTNGLTGWTTPVTAPGTTLWVSGQVNLDSGTADSGGVSRLRQALTVTPGWFEIAFDVTAFSGVTANAQLSLGSDTSGGAQYLSQNITGIGRQRAVFLASSSTLGVAFYFGATAGRTTATLDNFSIKPLGGTELLPNGDFTGDSTGWTLGANWTVSGGRADVANSGATSYLTSTDANGTVIVPGRFYEINYRCQVTAGAIQIDCGGGNAPAQSGPIGPLSRRAIVRAVNTNGFRVFANATAAGWVDDISVREIPGNHILQPTTTARPVLSSRLNRFVATEDFTNTTAWPRSGGATLNVTANAFVAPDGTMTGDELIQVAGGSAQAILQQFPDAVVAGTKLISRVRLRAGTASTAAVTLYNSTDAAHAASSALIISGPGSITGTTFRSVSGLTSEWTTVEITVDAPITGKLYRLMVYPNSTGAGVAGQSVGIWGAQMEQNNNASNYQRVNTTTDYNVVGFPLYLRFDGVDDYMTTPTAVPMGLISTFDTSCAFAREQNAAIAVLIEYGNGASAPDGSFAYFAPLSADTATNLFRLRGTVTLQNAVAQPLGVPVVMSARAVINSGFVMRYNAGIVASNGTSQAGALTDQILYLGARSGATLPFKGRFYGLITPGRRLSSGEMFNVERFLGQKSGVFV